MKKKKMTLAEAAELGTAGLKKAQKEASKLRQQKCRKKKVARATAMKGTTRLKNRAIGRGRGDGGAAEHRRLFGLQHDHAHSADREPTQEAQEQVGFEERLHGKRLSTKVCRSHRLSRYLHAPCP